MGLQTLHFVFAGNDLKIGESSVYAFDPLGQIIGFASTDGYWTLLTYSRTF